MREAGLIVASQQHRVAIEGFSVSSIDCQALRIDAPGWMIDEHFLGSPANAIIGISYPHSFSSVLGRLLIAKGRAQIVYSRKSCIECRSTSPKISDPTTSAAIKVLSSAKSKPQCFGDPPRREKRLDFGCATRKTTPQAPCTELHGRYRTPKELARNAKNPGKTRVLQRRGQEPNFSMFSQCF